MYNRDGRAWYRASSGDTCVPLWSVPNPTASLSELNTSQQLMDIDETFDERRVVPYDCNVARETLKRMVVHSQDTMDAWTVAQESSTAESPTSNWPPPEWKGCRLSFYCIRNCADDGKHLKPNGRPGGRGMCRIRSPPDGYMYPPNVETFEEATRKRKREQCSSSPHGPDGPHSEAASTTQTGPDRTAQKVADQEGRESTAAQAADVVKQGGTEAAAAQATAAQVQNPPPSFCSEIKTLRAAFARLEKQNNELQMRVAALEERNKRQLAALLGSVSPPPL